MKFHVELELDSSGPIGEPRFDALADALYDLDTADPALADTDLGASLTDGTIDVTMTVEADDPAAACTKALCAVRAAVHAIGDGTPGWETARSAMRVTPADAPDRLSVPA